MKTITLQDEETKLKVTLKLQKRRGNSMTASEMRIVEKSLVRAIVNGVLERIPYVDFGAESLKVR